LPSLRNARPVFSNSMMSPADGSSMDGGAAAATARSTAPIRAKVLRKRGYCAASFAENAPMLSLARATSCQRTRARPSSVGAQGVSRRPEYPQTMRLEAERADERRVDRRRVRQRRTAKAGRDHLGPRAPAHAIGAFEDDHLQAGPRQQRRGHQTVDAAADEDGVRSHIVRRSWFGVRRSPFVVCRSSFVRRSAWRL